MPEFLHRGLRLRWFERGDGTPLLFLHGMGGSHRQVFAALDAMPGIRLVAPDMQGHGDSEADWDGYGFGALADDALALMDHLGLKRFWLGGISLGAAVAGALAIRHPGRALGLCLVRPAWTDQPMAPDVQRLYALCAEYLAKDDREGFAKTPEFLAAQGKSEYTSGALLSFFGDPASIQHFRKFQALPPAVPYSAEDLKGIGAGKTLVVACRNDLVHPYEMAEFHARLIPGANLVEIPDKDTDPAAHRARMNGAIREWLSAEATG